MADRIVQLKDQNDNRIYPVIASGLYPVGSIYMSINSVSPATIFGGTWQQIKDTFLLACGDTYANGSTGGEATHTLTVSEMPSHDHERWFNFDGAGYAGGNWKGALTWSEYGDHGTWASDGGIRDVGSTGGGQAHNNLPPYLAVYVWVRTA